MADFDPIGPLKPMVPPAKPQDRSPKSSKDEKRRKPDDSNRTGPSTEDDGSTHQVDDYA